MAQPGRLSAVEVAKIVREARPGYVSDGGNLYLCVSKWGTPTWAFRYRVDGRLREMGLGSLHTISLREARAKATEYRGAMKKFRDGEIDLDLIDTRRAAKQRRKIEAARAMTFKECAERYIAAHRAGWRNAKHAAQWPQTLNSFAFPVFGDLPVAAVDTALVMKAIEPIWTVKPETASRVRGRIEAVLDWAKVAGYREGENPGRWKGHLKELLPAKSKIHRTQHLAAMAFEEIGGFMAELAQQSSIAARGLEFLILTASRTGEVRYCAWSEIDVDKRLWTIPAARMKGARDHRVPLSDGAQGVIKQMQALRQSEYVFPGRRGPLSETAMLMTLRRSGRALTAHGFRSAFRDWAAERTNFPRDVAEMALAHQVGTRVEQAYMRSDLFEKRRQLAEAWAKFCAQHSPAGEIVPIRRRATAGV